MNCKFPFHNWLHFRFHLFLFWKTEWIWIWIHRKKLWKKSARNSSTSIPCGVHGWIGIDFSCYAYNFYCALYTNASLQFVKVDCILWFSLDLIKLHSITIQSATKILNEKRKIGAKSYRVWNRLIQIADTLITLNSLTWIISNYVYIHFHKLSNYGYVVQSNWTR